VVEGVVGCAPTARVGEVDVCRALEVDLRRSAAFQRSFDAAVLDQAVSIEGLIEQIRELDDTSDRALRALLQAGRDDEYAVEMVVVALMPLLLSRCVGSSDRVDEMIGELAIVIGEAGRHGLPPSDRRVANVLLDRAWGRVRRAAQRVHEAVATDPLDLGWSVVDRALDPAEVAVGRVALEELLRSLESRRRSHRATVRAWNLAVGLADLEERSRSDRVRLKYARRVLRRSFVADQVA
jgi:hypothetical protein